MAADERAPVQDFGLFALLLLIGYIPRVLATCIYGVGIHRLILRNEDPGWIVFRVGRYERAYAAMLLIFFLIFLLKGRPIRRDRGDAA